MTIHNVTSQGGLRCGGSAFAPPVYWAGSDAPSETEPIFQALETFDEDGTGGIEAGGDSNAQGIYFIDATGSIEAGGVASFDYDETASGSIEAGGISHIVFKEVASGGMEAGGVALYSIEQHIGGGVGIDGTSFDFQIANDTASGGASVGSIANENIYNHRRYNILDPTKIRLIFGGQAGTRLDVNYIASGGITLASDNEINFQFNGDLSLLWRVNAFVLKDATFLWNTGELQIFWYRVVGKQSGKCEPLQPCCQKMITNIHARTPAELCRKLQARRFQFKIDSVQKFTRPAENDQVLADDDGCNKLEPVQICEVPACADFCVDFEPQIYMGIETLVQVDSFFEYEPESSSVYIGGSAEVDFFRIVPDFPYEAAGGFTIGDTADWISSGYGSTWNGGFVIGGTAKQKSSHWDYIGGEWPLVTNDSGGTEAESLDELITDVPWGAVDRVLVDDLLPTQVDLSFGKTSEYLIVRGFDINIPDDAEIRGVIVKVNRSSSNIGVLDENVYLVVGEEIISDNLANPPDWPLIQTQWWYGNTGGEQDPNRPWVAEDSDLPPLQAVDLNDPQFGFAIRIKSRTTLSEIFAFITYVDIAIYYEDAGDVHILQTGGTAGVISTAYSYEFSEGMEIGGSADLRLGRRYLTSGISPTLTAAFTTGGSYGRHYKYEPDLGYLTDRIKRGVECGGSALVTPHIYDETVADADGVDLGGTSIVSTGKVQGTGARVGGTAHVNPLPVMTSGGASMSGAAKVAPYEEMASGGLVVNYKTPEELTLGGEAFCKPSWQQVDATGGVSLGGESKITPYIEIGSGGAVGANRPAKLGGVNSAVGSGGVEVSPASISPVEELYYTASGSITVEEGEGDYSSSNYHFTSDGAAIFVLGGADIVGSDLGVQMTNVGVEFEILELDFNYGVEETEEIEIPSGTITRCACPEMSFVTEVSHNMVRDNRFAKFLVRNNFSISRILTLNYNLPNDSWQTNLHYRGVSSKNNNLEDWNIVMELRCTSFSGGTEIGENIWQFSVRISVEDLITGQDADTRVLVGLIPDTVCSAGELSFNVDYDTEFDFVSVSPTSVVYNNILYDNIGLFKNRAWAQSPILSFEVSQSGIDALTPRYDARGFSENRPLQPV